MQRPKHVISRTLHVFALDNGNDDDSMQTIKTNPEGRKCERARAELSVRMQTAWEMSGK